MVSKTAGYHSFVRLSLCDTACAKAMVQREGLARRPPIRLEFNHFDDRFGGRLFWTANPAAPISAASRRWIERAALSRSEERRVGKECRSRWWPDVSKIKCADGTQRS